jgi:D-glycero-alpha-D-manno-heptose-7-phosphate kinase
MIISRTPFRISFFGGGTDYPDWYLKHGGAVLSTTFDKYCYITCRELPPFFDHKYRIAYSVVENAKEVCDIKHPAVRAVLQEMGFEHGLEIHVDADLPARSGLGSSSSFIVGLLNSLYALKGQRLSRDFLAREAIRIEQEVIAESVGSQDQTAAAYGGFNVINFQQDGGLKVEPVILAAHRKNLLNSHLMLFFTGFSRIASEIAKDQIANIDKKVDELHRMRRMVDEALDILSADRDIRLFGELLHTAWVCKQSLSDKVSSSQIDNIYDTARKAGAIGGKLLGAGGGGFMLLFVEPEKQSQVREALKGFVHVPFQFETAGSQVIYYEP